MKYLTFIADGSSSRPSINLILGYIKSKFPKITSQIIAINKFDHTCNINCNEHPPKEVFEYLKGFVSHAKYSSVPIKPF